MAATLTWTETAIAQLADIAEYIAQDSLPNAGRVVERVIAAAEALTVFPLQGRVVPEFDLPDLREVISDKYRVIYRATQHSVRIIAVVHGARLIDDLIDTDVEPH